MNRKYVFASFLIGTTIILALGLLSFFLGQAVGFPITRGQTVAPAENVNQGGRSSTELSVDPGGSVHESPDPFQLIVQQTQPPEVHTFLDVRVRVYLKAELSNRGPKDAQDVRAVVKARVGNSYVRIDGTNQLEVFVGYLGQGSTDTRDLTFELRMSLFQGRQAEQDGIVFEISVLSTDAQLSFPPIACTNSGCSGP